MSDQAGGNSPHLDEVEQQQARDNASMGPLVIHEIVREQGELELERSFSGLAWSAVAAGLSIGFSFVAQAYLQAGLPQAGWSRLVDGFGYSLGFLIVILGQQQLFTETTLTALIPVLTRRDPHTLLRTMRVWVIVLAGNLIGTFIFSSVISRQGLVTPEAHAAMITLAAHTMSQPFWPTVGTAAAAGWLIGLMVWLLPGAGPSRPLLIILLTYTVAMCQFPHIVAGSVEAAFSVLSGHAAVGDYLGRFFLPTLLGNTIGGTALVALINHAQIADELKRGRAAGN